MKCILVCSLLLWVAIFTNLSFAATDESCRLEYAYPDQPGKKEFLAGDPANTLLTDGKMGIDGKSAIFGKWDVQNVLIDWNFKGRVRVTKVEVVINHPASAAMGDSHPNRLALYVGDDKGQFAEKAIYTAEIPFQSGPQQTNSITIPNGGIVAQNLRTKFITNRHQIVLCEVNFNATPTTDAVSKVEEDASTPTVKVDFFPPPMPKSRPQKQTPFFGVCGHMMHTNFFFPDKKFNQYWGTDFTIPLVVSAGIDWVREPIYQPFFSDDDSAMKFSGKKAAANRSQIENNLSAYDQAGIAVLLTPMYAKATDPGIAPFARWVGELAKKHPCIRAIELHNEPNLSGFWEGTPAEFVAASTIVADEIRKNAPNVTLVAGSCSGWGAAWDRPNMKALVQGPKEISTLWAENAFKEGLLKLANATSSHPYRGPSAPEGGDITEDRRDPDGFEKEVKAWISLCEKSTPGNRAMPFYITEIGYSVIEEGPDNYARVSSEARQADYLSRLMLLCLKIRMEGIPLAGVFWYDLMNDIIDSPYEANFGLVSTDSSTRRPAYFVYGKIATAFPDVLNLVKSNVEYAFTQEAKNIKSFSWKEPNKSDVSIAFWRLNQLQTKDVDFQSEMMIHLPNGFGLASIELTDLHETTPRLIGFKVDGDGKVRIPLQVTARAAWITLHGNRAGR